MESSEYAALSLLSDLLDLFEQNGIAPVDSRTVRARLQNGDENYREIWLRMHPQVVLAESALLVSCRYSFACPSA